MVALDQMGRFLNGLALQKFPPQNGESLPVIKIAQLRAGTLKVLIELAPSWTPTTLSMTATSSFHGLVRWSVCSGQVEEGHSISICSK